MFITFEGGDGSGKSTQSLLLCKYLQSKGYEIVHTREPGGVSISETFRKILLNPKNNIFPLTELLLYAAARAQHTQELILPALKSGKIVVCERYIDATLAYQGYARGFPLPLINTLNNLATNNLKPDLTLLLDIDITKGLKNVYKRKVDRLERESISFHLKVRKGYRKIAKKNKRRIKLIHVANNVNETQKQVRKIVDEYLKHHVT